MKNALKKARVWIIGGALTVIGVGVPFLVLVITLNLPDAYPFQYPLLLGAFAATFLLVGFVWGDLYVASYRRKNKNWDDKLPEEIKESAWSRRWSWYIASAICILVFMIFEIIFWISGSYPFL